VIGSSAATGKTSLIQLLEKKLEGETGATVVRIDLNSTDTVESLFQDLAAAGISRRVQELRQLKNTWLLFDDAQNAYDQKYHPFWHFIVKSISGGGVDDNVFVVVAATYDLSTPESPVNFRSLEHIDPNLTEDEVRDLFLMHAEVWDIPTGSPSARPSPKLASFPEHSHTTLVS
jgi:hypothetical protein